MAARQEDAEREERITMEIVVDAYNSDEQAVGWYCYLENTLTFPFQVEMVDDPSRPGRPVTVTALADADDCRHEMYVTAEWVDEDGDEDEDDLPLADVRPVKADAKTAEAVADWHYWTEMGYQL